MSTAADAATAAVGKSAGVVAISSEGSGGGATVLALGGVPEVLATETVEASAKVLEGVLDVIGTA